MLTRRGNLELRSVRHGQRGVALPLIAVSLLTMLAIAGLAMDASHALANKTRLQNTTDAAALAAAKYYDQTQDIGAANATALGLFGLNANGPGNHELDAAYDAGEIDVLIQWSETLVPFASTGVGPFVRVIATGYRLNSSLTAVLGIAELDIAASAVAGPSTNIEYVCNMAPMVVCSREDDAPPLFGYEFGELLALKQAASHACGEVGSGNYHLIDLGCDQGGGAGCARDNMAGAYEGCSIEGDFVETKPGNTVSVAQGLNTRFGDYHGSVDADRFPPDVVTTEPDKRLSYNEDTCTIMHGSDAANQNNVFDWGDYENARTHGNFDHFPPPRGTGVPLRRVFALPIAKCDGSAGGHSSLEVLGFGCFFVLQTMDQKGNESHVYGQFIEGCLAGGMPGPTPGTGPEPYRIQLYKDPDSGDS